MAISFLTFVKMHKLPLNRKSIAVYCKFTKHLDKANSNTDWIPLPGETWNGMVCDDFVSDYRTVVDSDGNIKNLFSQFIFYFHCAKCGLKKTVWEMSMREKKTKTAFCRRCYMRSKHGKL